MWITIKAADELCSSAAFLEFQYYLSLNSCGR